MALQKRPPIPGKNEANNQNRGMKDTGKTPAAPKSPNVKENGEKNGKRGCMAEWHTFLGNFSLPRKSEHVFQKWVSTQFEFFAHTLPIPCNN